ncbi:MAG: hypothetical protein AB8F95_08880, partial [Bacteroidia bacterium]
NEKERSNVSAKKATIRRCELLKRKPLLKIILVMVVKVISDVVLGLFIFSKQYGLLSLKRAKINKIILWPERSRRPHS